MTSTSTISPAQDTSDPYTPGAADLRCCFEAARGDAAAAVFLADNSIDPAPVLAAVGAVKLVTVVPTNDRSANVGFGDGEPNALAIPVLAGGQFVDLLLVDLDLCDWRTARGTQWLGRDAIAGQVVRLHRDPVDWLEAGCAGACHVTSVARGAAWRDLSGATSVGCDDIATALTAWDGLGGHEEDLSRFNIDDDQDEAVVAFFNRCAVAIARSEVRTGQ